MDKTEFDKLDLKIGQKIDLKMKKVSPHNIIFDGIREYNDYGLPETYILYHRIEAVKLEEIIGITPLDREGNENNSDEQKMDDQQEQKMDEEQEQNDQQEQTSTHEPESEKSESKPQIESKHICSCGKSYANAGALWNHTKKTGHAKA